MTNRELPLISPSFFAFGALTALLFALAAACSGNGGPACPTGTPTEPLTTSATASLTMKVGSYEGTGAPQCISGVGFQPVLVIIKGDLGGHLDPWTVWRSGSMEGDFTLDFAAARDHDFWKDNITSLDPDAFSVGKHAAVNAEGPAYYYVAFADSPDIKVGSYIGDATEDRSITGVGFQPTLVFLKVDGRDGFAVWRSTTHPPGVSSLFHTAGDAPDLIKAFEADGFRVGSASNGDGGIYHFVAFREAPGRLTTGTYTGDGSGDRDVTGVGFQPDYVWIKRSSPESRAVHRPSSLPGDATLRFGNEPNGADEITSLQADGFRVGSAPSVNFEGDVYHYVAWKASSGP